MAGPGNGSGPWRAPWTVLRQEGSEPVGCTNSRHAARFGHAGPPSATSGTPREAGIDTATFLLRVRDERDQAAAAALCQRPHVELPGLAMRADWYAGYELLRVEGRPATVLGREGLLAGDELPDALEVVRETLRDNVGVRQAADAGMSRVDLAATFRFERPADGWALLRGLHGLDAPRMKPGAIGRPIETVEWRSSTGRRRLARAYDKGVEAGIAPAGTLIRLEAQQRYPQRTRQPAGLWTSELAADEFGRRFRPLKQATDGGLIVASETVVREQLRELVERGALGATQARTLMGHLAAESVGLPTSGRTRRRNRAELRRLGLAQALDGVGEGDAIDVDLAAILDGALAAAW